MIAKEVFLFIVLAVLVWDPSVAGLNRQEKTKKQHKKRHVIPEVFHKRQVTCDDDQFPCSKYSCISTDGVCDTVKDCYNNKDEEDCPPGCTGPHQFKCDDQCISHRHVCDGQPDCTDWSDEANCGEHECLDGNVQCLDSMECLPVSYRCDEEKDCRDGSDEEGCPENTGTCTSFQFQCASGSRRCISDLFRCDGNFDCIDESDEQGCTCASDEFKCKNGLCVHAAWKCDGDSDCLDHSDEVGCPAMPVHKCQDVLSSLDCYYMNATTHPICTIHADGHKFCRKFCNLCQKS